MMKTLPFLSCVALLALSACSNNESVPPAPAKVLVQPVSRGGSGVSVYSGEIRARHEIDLAFRVGGKLLARLVDVGAEIKPGQPLARLDPADLQLAAEAARAQLAAAESDLTTAQSERERYAGLLAKKFVSQAAFEAKDNAFNAAQARLAQAHSQSRLSGNQAAYGTLSAESPAVVTAVLAEAGQVVAAGQPVLRIARPEEKEVLIAVPEGQVAALRAARSIEVSLWAAPEGKLVGQLRELSPAADPATRTYAARIRLVNKPATLQLGMTARVVLTSGDTSPIVVPLTAVVDQGKGPVVWVVQDGKAKPRAVVVRQFREDGVVLSDGLSEGELLIVAGVSKLAAEQPVTPQTVTPAAGQR
jgi:RND family efflux transporter MFP subunit